MQYESRHDSQKEDSSLTRVSLPSPESHSFFGSDHDSIAIFNCFIWDFCCFLWKGSSLPSLDPSSRSEARTNSICFTDLSQETLESLHKDSAHVRWALSITHGSVFAGYAADFVKKHKLENTPNAIRGKQKVEYLQYLKERGLHGVYEFLTTFVSSLANRKAQRQRASNKT